MTNFARVPTSVFSGRALARLRGIEQLMGQPFEHLLRHPAANRATAPRRHKITDRRERKLAARYRAAVSLHFQHVTGDPAGFQRLDGAWFKTAHAEFQHAA